MVAPGISSARIPVTVRLFVALAFTLSVLPLVEGSMRDVLRSVSVAGFAGLLGSEIAIGVSIGMMARCLFLALQFGAVTIASLVGANSGIPTLAIEDDEASQPFANLITLSAVVLFFVTDLHAELVVSLVKSFDILPLDKGFDAATTLREIVESLGVAFLIALQISAPFVMYSLLVNLLLGLINRMIPQVPVQFVSAPVLLGGGVVLLSVLIGPIAVLFNKAVADWLAGP